MAKRKVLLVSPLPPPYGGIARWTEQIIAYLDKDKSVEYKHLDIAVRWRSVHANTWLRLVGGLFQLVANYLLFLWNMFTTVNVIHLTSSGGFGLARDALFCLTGKFFLKKFIIHIRFGRIVSIFSKKNYEYYLLKFVFRFSDRIICIDASTYKFLNENQYLGSKLNLIPNCISYDFEEIIQDERSNIISFVGWVKKEKGVGELIASFINLKLENWTLRIIGPLDNDFYASLENKYDFSKYGNIHFLGDLPHTSVIQEMKQSKIFVLPSYTEGFPNVVLEAMATKNAIISTKVGAIPEMLAEQSGLLVDVANQKQLQEALNYLSITPSLQMTLSNNAFHRCKIAYSIEHVVKQYIEIWES